MTYRRNICPVAAITIFLMQCFAYRVALATEPQRVLFIYNSVGYAEVVTRNIRAELQQRSPHPIETYFAPFSAARGSDQSVSARYADYLGSLFPDQRLELAVAVGSPAMRFLREHGRHIFPSTPMLAIVEESRAPATPERNETIVTSYLDLAGAIENILQLLPDTTSISIVIGNSPLEQYWLAKERLAFQPFASRISFRWLNDLSFDELLKRASTLPPRSAILFNSLFSDALGRAYDDHEVVSKLHTVATAPIFTFDVSDFGEGIVGGPWPSTEEVSRNYASVALRILGGEALGGLKIPGIANGPPKFDWREMQRWSISESRLPPGSEIRFREPTAWQQYQTQILVAVAALLIQSTIIWGLLIERHRRRVAEQLSRDRLADIVRLNQITTAEAMSSSITHELKQPLSAIMTNAEAAKRLLIADPPDIDEVREIVDEIITADQRADEIITHMRQLLKKKPEVEYKVFDINDVAESVLRILSFEAKRKKVFLETEPAPGPLPVRADPVHVRQVLLNLGVNAIDAMMSCSPDKRRLVIRTAPVGQSDVMVSVLDRGPGLPEDRIQNIFQAFVTTKDQGTGLGLSIARTIIETYGGKIWAENRPEGGAAFRFTLALARQS
jgi:signal transduction histidine kinase